MLTIREMEPDDRSEADALVFRILGRCVERSPASWEPSFVAVRDGQIVGHVSLCFRDGVAEGRNFVVDESARGSRVALRLMETIEREALRGGCSRIRGVIEKTNPTFARMAQKWGGTVVADTPIDWIFEENLFTRKGLSHANATVR